MLLLTYNIFLSFLFKVKIFNHFSLFFLIKIICVPDNDLDPISVRYGDGHADDFEVNILLNPSNNSDVYNFIYYY